MTDDDDDGCCCCLLFVFVVTVAVIVLVVVMCLVGRYGHTITIRYNNVYLMCSKKLMGSQLGLSCGYHRGVVVTALLLSLTDLGGCENSLTHSLLRLTS